MVRATALSFLLATASLASIAETQTTLRAPRYDLVGDQNYEAVADLDQNGTIDGVVSSLSGWFTVLDVGINPTVGAGIPGLGERVVTDLGDVTGDGLVDLVVRYYSSIPPTVSSGVRIYPGRGDGSFDPPFDVSNQYLTYTFVLADVNGDGTKDVVTLDRESVAGGGYTYRVSAWILNGAVPFAAPSLALPSRIEQHAMAVVDRDGDGSEEVAFVRYSNEPGGPDVYLVEWDANANPRLFQLLEVVPGDPSTRDLAIAAGDVDGDGDDDLVFTRRRWTPPDNTTFVLENVGGTFVTGTGFRQREPGGSAWLGRGRMADWDGDGDDDLLYFDYLPSPVSARIYLGRSEGLTVQPVTFWSWPTDSVPSGSSGLGPWGIAGIEDLDGDGHLDLISSAAVMFGRGVLEPIGEKTVTEGCCASNTMEAEDVDGDGDLDLVSGSRYITINDGTGKGPLVDVFADIVLPGTELLDQVFARGDFDGDGYEDLAVEWGQPAPTYPYFALLGTRLLRGQADGVYLDGGVAVAGVAVGSQAPPHWWNPSLPNSADFDGDGNLDVLGIDGWYPGDGAGHFGDVHPYLTGERPLIADLDGDGDPDLLIPQTSGNGTSWHFHSNDGSGNFTEVQALGPFLFAAADPLLLDFDRDGLVDLCFAVRDSTNAGLHVALNLGSGAYTAPVRLLHSQDGYARVTAGDVNGDGLTDILGMNSVGSSTRFELWLATASGGVYELEAYYGPYASAIADMDGDGDGDLVSFLLTESTTFDTPSSGSIRQYGFGYGGGPVAPILGAKGPFRPSTTSAELRIARGIGGACYGVFWGTMEVNLVNFPFLGSGVFIAPRNLLFTGVLGGAPGAEGEGSVAIDVTAFTTALPGFTIPLQAALMHPGYPSFLALTNAVSIGFGF